MSKIEALIEQMDEGVRKRYHEMKAENVEATAKLAELSKKLKEAEETDAEVSKKLQTSIAKKKAIDLLTKLDQLKIQKAKLESERQKSGFGDVEEEREMLLKQVKEDNQEIAVMEQKIAELEDKCESARQSLKEQDGESKGSRGSLGNEKSEKLDELLKRDREIQSFLSSFVDRKTELEDSLHRHEIKASELLDRLGVGISC